jgi:hypothetical protein
VVSITQKVCDGYDVDTENGIIHFTTEPTPADIDMAIATRIAMEEAILQLSVDIIAEDGTVLDG